MELNPPTLDIVRDYYGRALQSRADLRTGACCTPDNYPDYIKDVLKEIDDEILDRFYGCGSPIPPGLDGCTVVDLGCGTGRDAFIASRLVGPKGRIIGVDMTDEQLAVAEEHRDSQARRFGFKSSNVEFRKGYIEDLAALGIEDESVDVVISNCVINLSPDKRSVFSEIYRVLKPGGEVFFSDVFSDRRIPDRLTTDPILYGECLGGALYVEDFRRLFSAAGFIDHRTTRAGKIEITNRDLRERIGNITFTSRTIRAFKIQGLEDRCEDYGQIARYRGTLPHSPFAFELDDHHFFERGKSVPVCGNTAAMLTSTRYGEHFDVAGDRSVHFGLFDCAASTDSNLSGTVCC